MLALVLPGLTQAADAKPPRPGNDIIGGGPASPGEYPFMAAILNKGISGSDFDRQFCGGSLIDDEWVLTAAHCTEGIGASQLAVAVGRTVLSSGVGERRDATAVVRHPQYNQPVALANDAALLKVFPPITGIAPIRLTALADADRFEVPPQWLTVIGWGTTSTRKPAYSDVLREVDVPAVDDPTCRSAYGTSLHALTMVCAGAPNIDSCYGDSGGPLFATEAGSRIQVGIVSWGRGCAKKRYPGVYSEVNSSSIRGWIRDTSGV
jgi:secreted trypsin-like serine protease